MRVLSITLLLVLLTGQALVPSVGHAIAPQEDDDATLEDLLGGLSWRSIGPAFMGGRTVDLAGVPGRPNMLYMATASGGLFRTEDRGVTWESIFDDGGTLSLGAVAVAPSDPNVVYLGTGEHNPRNSTSFGDGVYRSTDGGDTWTHIGLEATERIARIRVHPDNPDHVYVGAMGHAWGAHPDRGVYRSLDGGETWEKVLYVDETTGVSDLAMDATNPRVLYAGMWDFLRQPWNFRSGGPGSGLYMSRDGGDSWTELTDEKLDNGLPSGVLGRIGVAVAVSDHDVVYAMIESTDGALWRSSDGGSSWGHISDDRAIASRPFYYSDFRIDPSNENRLYMVGGRLNVSTDGGRTWRRIGTTHHGDHQSFWINPDDPMMVVDGNDGGIAYSYNGGETWELVNNLPLQQVYQLGADMRDPYFICAGFQDNDAWCGPSNTMTSTGILEADWYHVQYGDGTYIQPDPSDHNIVYAGSQGGSILRIDLRTNENRSIRPYPFSGGAVGEHPYRFNWNSPIHISPHDPKAVYLGGNVLFRTSDGGDSWVEISPDLTTNDEEKQRPSGGPITPDNTTAEYHTTIYTIAESPVRAGVIWVGTDDGNVQVTRDDGAVWTNVVGNIPVPPESWVSRIEASRRDAGTAYVAFDRHRLDDFAPYLFMTTDFGDSWTDIGSSLPDPGYLHVVREDPRNPDLLYVGTELGIFASWGPGHDDSEMRAWTSLRLGLPPVAVRDVLIHPRNNDLIIGTHGRSILILDDITPLQQLLAVLHGSSGAAASAEGGTAGGTDAAVVHLFDVPTATRFQPYTRELRVDLGDKVFVGANPPYGAVISYFVPPGLDLSEPGLDAEGSGSVANVPESDDEASPEERASGEPADADDEPAIKIEIQAADGEVVRTLEAPAEAGLNRVAWNLRHQSEEEQATTATFPGSGPTAPLVIPATYRVVLKAAGTESATELVVRMDPRVDVSLQELRTQRDALLRLADLRARSQKGIERIDDLVGQLQSLGDRIGDADAAGDLASTAEDLSLRLDEIRSGITSQPRADADSGPTGPYIAGPKIHQKLRTLASAVGRASAAPTQVQADWLERLEAGLEEALGSLETLVQEDLGKLNRRVLEANIPFIRQR